LSPSAPGQFAVGCLFPPALAISRNTTGVKSKQSPLGNQQIRQGKQREELYRVLGQPAKTHLPQREHILDQM